jgi:serine protease Do
VALPLPNDNGRTVASGKRHVLEARLIGVHKETDLALLKIDEKDLPTLPLLSQERPRVGQMVFAIGSPEGLQNSVTMGVVSAVARQADPDKPLTYIHSDRRAHQPRQQRRTAGGHERLGARHQHFYPFAGWR